MYKLRLPLFHSLDPQLLALRRAFQDATASNQDSRQLGVKSVIRVLSDSGSLFQRISSFDISALSRVARASSNGDLRTTSSSFVKSIMDGRCKEMSPNDLLSLLQISIHNSDLTAIASIIAAASKLDISSTSQENVAVARLASYIGCLAENQSAQYACTIKGSSHLIRSILVIGAHAACCSLWHIEESVLLALCRALVSYQVVVPEMAAMVNEYFTLHSMTVDNCRTWKVFISACSDGKLDTSLLDSCIQVLKLNRLCNVLHCMLRKIHSDKCPLKDNRS